MEQSWENILKNLLGGFCSGFAQHPHDIEQAKKAVLIASKSGVTVVEFIEKAEEILEYKKSKPHEYIEIISQVQSFCSKHYL